MSQSTVASGGALLFRLRLDGLLAAQQGRLLLWLPVALAVGILAYFQLPAEPDAAWQGLALLPFIAVLLLWHRAPALAAVLALATAAALGFGLAAWHAARALPLLDLPRGAVIVTGTVAEADVLPEGLRVTLRGAHWDGGPPAARHIRIRLHARDMARPEPGQVISMRALLRPPGAPTHPGAWDFQRAAWFSGLGGSGMALGPLSVVEAAGQAPPLAGLRATIEARVLLAVPGPAGAIAAALITGGQTAIAAPEMVAMRDSGLAHLLSVSGLHIAIVMGLSFWIIRFGLALWPWLALRVDVRLPASVAALALGGFYMVLTGSEVPMQRSFAMAALVTLALLAGRRALTLRGLAIAAGVVLMMQPAALLGPSFQMSFAAVLALIAAWEWVRPHLHRPGERQAWWRRAGLLLAGSIATSVLAGAATTPFGLYHFGRVQLYGVAANALAVPLTSFLVMPAGMAAALLMPLGLDSWPLRLMGWGVEGVLAIARFVAAWPGASLPATPLPGWGLAMVAAGMVWLALWRGGWRLLGVALILLGLGAGRFSRPPDALISADGRLIGLRHADGQVFLARGPGASRFVVEAWLRAWGQTEAAAQPDCTGALCRLRLAPDGPLLVMLRHTPPPPRGRNAGRDITPPAEPPCGQAAIILSPEPVRGRCEGSVVIDRFSVWRDGAHAVWLGRDGAMVLSDRAARGDRPWVPPRPLPRFTPDGQPAALTE